MDTFWSSVRYPTGFSDPRFRWPANAAMLKKVGVQTVKRTRSSRKTQDALDFQLIARYIVAAIQLRTAAGTILINANKQHNVQQRAKALKAIMLIGSGPLMGGDANP